MSRLGLLAISAIAGVALAFAITFAATLVLAGSSQTPAGQQLYNYGTR